jgi:hypothetical protein
MKTLGGGGIAPRILNLGGGGSSSNNNNNNNNNSCPCD